MIFEDRPKRRRPRGCIAPYGAPKSAGARTAFAVQGSVSVQSVSVPPTAVMSAASTTPPALALTR